MSSNGPTPTLLDRTILRILHLSYRCVGSMGWQKTFSLPRRSKGCHLVTDDVLAQISEGIKDVKVQLNLLMLGRMTSYYIPDIPLGWDAISLHVGEDLLGWTLTD